MIENYVIENKNGTIEWLKTQGIFCDCLKLYYYHHGLTQISDAREIKTEKKTAPIAIPLWMLIHDGLLQ